MPPSADTTPVPTPPLRTCIYSRRLQRLIDEARTASLPPKAPTAAKKKRIKGLARKDDRVRLAKKSRVADKKKSRSKKFGMDD
mmetsp:Transcript_63423/g.174537  ORF Transcript_63423/g.174537 Transcript_63423/m.174537 type:complete len:83 (-) Transcript_63423:391-639(-)